MARIRRNLHELTLSRVGACNTDANVVIKLALWSQCYTHHERLPTICTDRNGHGSWIRQRIWVWQHLKAAKRGLCNPRYPFFWGEHRASQAACMGLNEGVLFRNPLNEVVGARILLQRCQRSPFPEMCHHEGIEQTDL